MDINGLDLGMWATIAAPKRDESKIKVTTVIRKILLKNEDLRSLVGEKIFPLYAPEGTKGDFILYMRDAYTIDRTKMGIAAQSCKVFINIVSDDYDRSQDIADIVLDTLEGDSESGLRMHLADSTEDAIDKKYIQVLLFEISNS
jgi:hypothetical protein